MHLAPKTIFYIMVELLWTKGVEEVKAQNKDNFWEILPVERMQISDRKHDAGQTKNANFERAETKATKAIQKHSMNIGWFREKPANG